MMTIGEWINPTRASGLAAYGTAAICCAVAWTRTSARTKDLPLAAGLTVIEIALFLDVVFNWRWMIHQALMDMAQSAHEYDVRRLPQLIVIVGLAGVLIFGLTTTWRLFRGRPGALLAVGGVLLSVILWCTEIVSLHQVDHVLYHRLGNLMMVSFLWILASVATSIGVLADARPIKAVAVRRA